ncbi:hypothetical protein [Leucobacter chinensis]|uniref:hypothetical protein n=1 Tax=Leucobacter chinensis TaxID=2851010 RepID=UPI001C23C0A5|nr:hypothetical protein [Leucobacter chinensis]
MTTQAATPMWARARPQRKRVRGIAALALVTSLFAGYGAIAAAEPAHAASRVDVSPTPSAEGPTKVTLSGSGFQYQPNAPGGVYVFFGAVSDPTTNAWAPSQGGLSGQTYAYAATPGAQLLVAFQGGSSAEAANSMIDPNGNWTTEMTIPGSTFTATFGDPHSGNQQGGQEIDCLQVQCGIITIGAHGLQNANNESFTPISFTTSGGEVQTGTGAVQQFSAGEAPSNTDEATTLKVPEEEEKNEKADEKEKTEAQTEQQTVEAAPEAPRAENETLTWVVIGVLGFAVLALITATSVVMVKRSKSKKLAAATSEEPTTEGEGAAE